MVTRRGFLIGTAGVVATAAIAPRLIVPDQTLVANAQGIFLEVRDPCEEWLQRGTVAAPRDERWWVLPYAKIKFPGGRMLRTWADADEVKADHRRLQFQSDSRNGVFEIWNLPLQPAARRMPRIPNFVAYVERTDV
tara:strand:+ start:432 stop:839 length:408 start_codon:yes stop_codon:yes gene_type:complete